MAQPKTLTEAQVGVLRWVGNGCPDGVMEGVAHRISVGALQRRGLVTTKGRGPSWSATITGAGVDYLKQVDGSNPPRPRGPTVSVTVQLVNDVIAAGGSLRVANRSYGQPGVDYQHRVRLAIQHGKVPVGKRLTISRLSWQESQIDLVDAPEGTSPVRRPVPVPDRPHRYHPAVQTFRERTDWHEFVRASLARVSRLLQGLVTEAERRGYQVTTESPTDDRRRSDSDNPGRVVVTVDGYAATIAVNEEGVPNRNAWLQQHRSYGYSAYGVEPRRFPRRSEYEANATGRLTLTIIGPFDHERPKKWSDRKTSTLDELLPDVLAEIEVRAAEQRHRQREAERKEAERRQAWEAAMDRARELHAQHQRVEVLQGQVDRWHEAQRIRAFCDATVVSYPDEPATSEWVTWARGYADRLDPLASAPAAPPPPDNVSPGDLQPFLKGWSPYEFAMRRPR